MEAFNLVFRIGCIARGGRELLFQFRVRRGDFQRFRGCFGWKEILNTEIANPAHLLGHGFAKPGASPLTNGWCSEVEVIVAIECGLRYDCCKAFLH